MNRRNFFKVSVAGLALASTRVAAQSTTAGIFVSELTNSEWDFSASGFEIKDHTFAPENSFERVILGTEKGTLTFEMGVTGSEDMKLYLEETRTQYAMLFGAVEELGDGDEATGGWMAFSVAGSTSTLANYNEYQIEAFPGFDMVIQYSTDAALFAEEFAKVQSMDIGGLAPFMFAEQSKVTEIVFAPAAATSAGTTRTKRTSRAASNTTATEQPAVTQEAVASSGDPDFTAAVLTHYEGFHTLLAEFYEKLELAGADTTSDADIALLIPRLANIAIDWQQYPTQAAALTAPAGSESLGVLYTDWAAAIGEMGVTFEQFLMFGAEVDPFVAAVDVWEPIDIELHAQLNGLGLATPEFVLRSNLKTGLLRTRLILQGA